MNETVHHVNKQVITIRLKVRIKFIIMQAGCGVLCLLLFLVCCVTVVLCDTEEACFEALEVKEVVGNDCTLLNTCKFAEDVNALAFVYEYSLVNASGYPSEEYTVRYYLDAITSTCLNITECCVGDICNDSRNPLHGDVEIGAAYSGPSYSLYACNPHTHSAYVQGESHFEYSTTTETTTTGNTSIWIWISITFACALVGLIIAAAIAVVIYKKRKHAAPEFLE